MARPFGNLTAFLVFMLAVVGCAQRSSGPAVQGGEPLSLQMLRTEAELRKYPFRTLLEFEAATDPVFVRLEGASPKLDSSRSHTGTSSLLLERGGKSMVVRLPSLFTTAFPGRWALAGAYFYASQPQQLTAEYVVENAVQASISVKLPANQWTPVLLDVAAVADGKNAPTGVLRFTFGGGVASPLWCDDVLVMDNTQVHVDSRSSAPGGWLVKERGFQFTVDCPNQFAMAMQTPEASAQGWVLEEANEIRLRFASANKGKSCIVYSNGLQLLDGKATVLGAATPAILQQHASPAEITIAPEMGRLVRNAPGDANNDGYDELTGTYPIMAAAARMELTITPQTAGLTGPILEISKLPAGKVVANMEGRPIERIVRLEDGRVLLGIPGTLTRATMISLRVAQ
ncbi:MAG TPA: hypothetical protein VHP11_15865 [Tepidisphaeraceae bacterium]|nr:hypothetical protein [Tepidisphaeraceae bacterium]